jgi:hypothetical protein
MNTVNILSKVCQCAPVVAIVLVVLANFVSKEFSEQVIYFYGAAVAIVVWLAVLGFAHFVKKNDLATKLKLTPN